MQDLEGKTVVVTGSAAGMGRGFAECFGREGMNVVMADVEEKALRKAAAEVEAVGATIALFEGDDEILRYTDHDEPLLGGSAALVALAGGMFLHQELWVDDVEVAAGGYKLAVPTESTTWSNLKAIYR